MKNFLLVIVGIGIMMIGVAAVGAIHFQMHGAMDASPLQYRVLMDRADKFQRSGDLELAELVKWCIADNKLSVDNYNKCQQKGDEIERKYLIKHFLDGSYHFMEKDSIAVNKPRGYIERGEAHEGN